MQSILVDCGNSNIKAQLLNQQGQIVETLVMPSLISKRFSEFILGGFVKSTKEGSESVVVGFDNEGRSDCLNMAENDNGKLEFLHYLLAGVVSAFEPHLRKDAEVNWFVLTLNPDKRRLIQDAITYASSLVIDGKPLKLKSVLANCFPEGGGAAFYAASTYSTYNRVAVLDCGFGTCNLSTYSTTGDFPRRASFRFVSAGVSKLFNVVSELLSNDTSNGRVDERLISVAITTNTNRYYSDYSGRDITNFVGTAAEYWLNDVKLKPLIIEVIRLLSSGVPVVAVGGGMMIKTLREAIELVVLANVPDANLWRVPDNAHIIGVAGLGELASKPKQSNVVTLVPESIAQAN